MDVYLDDTEGLKRGQCLKIDDLGETIYAVMDVQEEFITVEPLTTIISNELH